MNLIASLSNVVSFVVPLLVVLGILILIHEAGHFYTARFFGIRPHIFSFGFGWRIAGVQRRGGRLRWSIGPLRTAGPEEELGTDYRISAIPFGGYVMLQGESMSEALTGDPREFRTRPRWQQLIVYVAGVALNIALAFALATTLFWAQGYVPVQNETLPIVDSVAPGSSAEAAGLRPGDRLLLIQNRDARDAMAFVEEILYAPSSTRSLTVERAGREMVLTMAVGMDEKYHLGVPGFTTRGSGENPLIIAVEPGGPAERAGLRAGDRVVRINEREAPVHEEITAIVRSSEGADVGLTVERDGARLAITVVPEKRDTVPMIGVRFAPGPMRAVGLAGAVGGAVEYCRATSMLLFVTIKQMVRGRISPRAMSGPLELAKVSRDTWREGATPFLWLLAFVSLQLGIINLIPIPGLDGGHILILLIEGAIRRDLPDRVKQWVITSGFAALLLFAAAVIYFDLMKWRF